MKELIAHHKALNKIAKLYLAAMFFQALYFSWPGWYGFTSQSLTPFQVGIYFSVFALIKVLAEVPTGAFADKYGRKRSALLGACMAIIIPLIWYFGHSFPSYLLAAVLGGISGAFLSGSLDAMVYDHPGVSQESYRHIAWLEITFFQTGLLLSAATGGLMYSINPGLPFIAEAISCIVVLFLVLLMEDTQNYQGHEKESETYIHFFKTGLSQLLANNYLRVLVLVGVLVAVIMTAGIEYLNEATMISYGLVPEQRGFVIAGVKILALLVINLILLKLLRKDRTRLIFIAIMGTIIFSILSINALPLFFIGFILFNWLSATQESFIRPILHDNLPSSHRATAMSGFSALRGLVAFGANIVFGALFQITGTPLSFYMFSVGIFILIIVPCVFWLTTHLKINATRK